MPSAALSRAVDLPLPPLVSGPPIVGRTLELMRDPTACFARSYRTHGPTFRIKVPGRTLTVMAGPAANHFLGHAGPRLRSREVWQGYLAEYGAVRNLIGLDGPEHSRQRKLMKRGFGKETVRSGFDEIVETTRRHAHDWSMARSPVVVIRAMKRLITEQMGRLLVDQPDVLHDFDDLSVFIRTALNVHVLKRWPKVTLLRPRYRRARRRVMALGRSILAAHRDPAVDRTSRATDLVDDIVHAWRDDPSLATENELLVMAVGALFSGLDTLANTLAFLLFELLSAPELLDEVTREADDFFRAPSFEGIKHLDVLRRAYLETLRLHPVAPAVVRVADERLEFAGHRIDADTEITFATAVCHQLPEFYRDPGRFDVDRYLPERAEHKAPGAFVPFGLGAHTCLGVGMAEHQGLLTVATLLHAVRMGRSGRAKLKTRISPTPGPDSTFRIHVASR